MQTSTRRHIRRQALRAAAKVALLGAGFGCGAEATEPLPTVEEEPPARPDAGARLDAGFDGGVVVVGDAGTLDAGGLDAGALETCDLEAMDPEAYFACCERIGWDWDRGCAAWGPPAPPALKGVA